MVPRACHAKARPDVLQVVLMPSPTYGYLQLETVAVAWQVLLLVDVLGHKWYVSLERDRAAEQTRARQRATADVDGLSASGAGDSTMGSSNGVLGAACVGNGHMETAEQDKAGPGQKDAGIAVLESGTLGKVSVGSNYAPMVGRGDAVSLDSKVEDKFEHKDGTAGMEWHWSLFFHFMSVGIYFSSQGKLHAMVFIHIIHAYTYLCRSY